MGLQLSETKPAALSGDYDFERYPTSLPARIMMLGHHLKMQEALCTMKDISCSGARLKVDPSTQVPPHFFLQINGMHDEIGCTMVSRTLEYVSLKFNMLLADDFLLSVLRRNEEFEKATH